MKRNGQTQLNFDVLSSTEMLDIVVFALLGGVNPRYERVLASFNTCHLELFLLARDPLSGSHKYRSITTMSFRRHEMTRNPVLQCTTSTIKTWIPSFAAAHYGMTLLSVIPQARSGKESGATTHNFHNHDQDSSIHIRALRNDTTKFGRCA